MVRYVRADSQSLISGLKSTLETANNVTNKLEQGSKHLINTVERKELSGAAYTAGKGLFQKFIVPTIKRADSAIEALKDDLARYQNADYEVNRWSLIDSDLQQELIQSIQRQLQTIDMQIQLFCQLEHSLIGDLAKPALQALRMDTQNLQQVKDALLDNLRKEEQKLNALYRFEGQTASLFEEASQQLKIVRQSIEVLSQMSVDPYTGNYTFPKGMDSSWFTMKKSKAEQQRIALLNGQDGLNLPPEAEKYYNEIMTEALKNVSIEQWDEALKELNQLLLFDDEGNILRVMPVNMGSGNGLIILKNGVNDQQLTLQANQELSVEQRELLKESLPQLAAGLLSTLTGLGILGLDFAGTYFSGGTLAAVGVTQAAAVTGSTLTGAGALTVTDAISKMGVQSSTASYSFANNYGERQQSLYPNGKYVSSPEHTPNGKGGWGSEMDLGVDEAQKVLDKAKQVGKQKYGLKDGQIYEFQPDGSGGWHGYKIKGTELTDKKGGADVLRDWLKEGKINNSQYNKLRRGK